eukprot:2413669-Amphidinium_carterae.1
MSHMLQNGTERKEQQWISGGITSQLSAHCERFMPAESRHSSWQNSSPGISNSIVPSETSLRSGQGRYSSTIPPFLITGRSKIFLN